MVYMSIYKYYRDSDRQSQNIFEFLTQGVFIFSYRNYFF